MKGRRTGAQGWVGRKQDCLKGGLRESEGGQRAGAPVMRQGECESGTWEKGGSSTHAASHTFHSCLTSAPSSPHERERAEQKGGPPFAPTSRARCKGAVLLGVFGLFGSRPPFEVTQKKGGPPFGEKVGILLGG
jgi:hypothetical protein